MNEEYPHAPLPESRFIPADDRCRHPEWWNSTDGDSTEVEVAELIGGLVRALQPELVVETGAAFGQTTKEIEKALYRNGHGLLYALETDPERATWVRGEMKGARSVIIEASSLDWEPPGPIDLLFSDSYYETRIPEFRHFRPWLRRGSIVVFHDTAPGRGEHRIESGRDLRSEVELWGALLRYVHLPTPRGLTIAEVIRPFDGRQRVPG